MIVNLANAIRLQERQGDAIKLLDSEDWSAVNDEFAISVAAVRNDVDAVVALLERIGPAGSPNVEDYRTWPVFRGMRSNPLFRAAFAKVFGVPVVLPEVQSDTQVTAEVPKADAQNEQGQGISNSLTRH